MVFNPYLYSSGNLILRSFCLLLAEYYNFWLMKPETKEWGFNKSFKNCGEEKERRQGRDWGVSSSVFLEPSLLNALDLQSLH